MKKYIIAKIMNYIKNNTNYDNIKLSEIEYGLGSLYLTVTKTTVILIIAYFLNITKEVIIFILLYNFLRLFAFGLHASKSWMCWLGSIIAFLCFPLLCVYIKINIYIKILICLTQTLLVFKNAPADTKKKPIVSKKRRKVYNIISTTIALLFSIIAIYTKNEFISNSLIFSMILENFLISPAVYKLFKLPYNNYITFLKEHPDFQN